MSSCDTWLNVLTGISQGSFDKIYLRDASGNMVDLLTQLGTLGGGITDVISQSSELVVTTNGTTKILTLNLGGYLSSSHEAGKVGNANVAFGAFDINARAVKLSSQTLPDKELKQGAAGELLWNGQELQLRQNAFHQINVAAPLTISGANVITIDTLWKPSTVSVATGLLAVANDAAGTLNLSLTGAESRTQLYLQDCGGTIRSLAPNTSGDLLWHGATLATAASIPNLSATAPIVYSNGAISTLFKPSTVSVAAGLVALANDTLGTLSLSLSGTENRSQLNLIDSQGVVRNLVPSITGTLTYNGSTLVDLTYLSSNYSTTTSMNASLASKQNNLTASTGIFLNGSTINSYTLRWNSTNTPSAPTAIEELHWDNYTVTENINLTTGKVELVLGHPLDMATQTWSNQSLATKQSTLANYSETAGATTTIAQYLYGHLAWGSGTYTNVANSHQVITIPLYNSFYGIGSGTCYMSVELRADTCNEAVFSVNDSTAWVQVSEIKFSGLSTTNWTTCSWSFPIPSNGNMNFHIGYIPTGSSLTQAPGVIHMKNLHLYKTAASATISSQLNCSGDVICSRTVTATSYTSTSDEAIKEDIQNASVEDCMKIFQSVDAKTYVRKDISGPRRGFIAQDVQSHVPDEFANILGMQYGGDTPLLSLDYSRMVCVLWTVCKDLKARVETLEGKRQKKR